MSGFVIPLLVGVLVLAAGNLLLGMVMVWRHSGLAERVARLEIYQQANLTHAETRQIYERLSSIEGQVQATNRVMQTVQEHLLEND
ncbi:hypothetical protein GGR74_002414 [Xanthomonas arboricola]|uniref:Uncharacterized protein n=1 Tax=Xanthomonas cucurbitae TaxID=56453 RepID=A0ABY7YAA8_9XANT|nr:MULTISPECIES: hypothetical protein [Xanthomonas]CAD7351595.1 hypothetical protein X12_003525 [Xanthomonas arboricola]KHS06590.1 hypothetical protein RM61_15090 [Xanthomonas phaseoli pv. phaseoli]MCP3048340.1 hypothetical protein [Xanthomonas euvesicatoria pv. allii]MEA9886131.1 hypothetical protein [Xanthomonas campestris pv. raphani]WDM70750.1 hypothetical protein K6978_15360 [Xanthomonas cucurbitae]